ncbi:MAG: hypothetical protein ABI780_07475 [Ardenticatenales bacterium]
MSQLGIWSITNDGPVRSDKVRIGLERYLEDWIERDPRMLPEDLTIVGRQVTLGEHRLDLLAISRTAGATWWRWSSGRWWTRGSNGWRRSWGATRCRSGAIGPRPYRRIDAVACRWIGIRPVIAITGMCNHFESDFLIAITGTCSPPLTVVESAGEELTAYGWTTRQAGMDRPS